MENVVRTGIAIPPELIKEFDRAIESRGYRNRSEAVRDLVRNFLIEERCANPGARGIGTFTVMYDHHSGSFTKRMTSIQHDYSHLIRSTVHTHLDKHNCLEVIILDGRIRDLKKFADNILALKGVKHGKLVTTSTGVP